MSNASSVAAAGFIAGALLLSACSTSSSQGSGFAMPQAGTAARAISDIAYPSGIDKRYAGTYEPIEAKLSATTTKVAVHDLFIADDLSSVFLFKNKTYAPDGTITNGLGDTNSVWIDNVGNVYVADLLSASIVEFAPGTSSPSCIYHAGLVDPVNVTTDSAGNVYAEDFNFLKRPGHIYVFPQCTDKVAKQYTTRVGPEGVAVDPSGDIFVSFFDTQFHGRFEEFVKGNPTGKLLALRVQSPGGLILDKKNDLILADQGGRIYKSRPPYTTDTLLVSGLFDPFRVALSKDEKLLFSANSGSGTVTIYSYPSDTLIRTLDSSDGLDGADGVSDSPNDTP
jgi:DNA-binding beta-propeller fold protein YncE